MTIAPAPSVAHRNLSPPVNRGRLRQVPVALLGLLVGLFLVAAAGNAASAAAELSPGWSGVVTSRVTIDDSYGTLGEHTDHLLESSLVQVVGSDPEGSGYLTYNAEITHSVSPYSGCEAGEHDSYVESGTAFGHKVLEL